MSNGIIIFSGPTITESEIHSFLPQVCCHDPVACGDIIRVLRLKPHTLIVIDGYFERMGSVWHKEILIAIEQGVKVYGASSMGALRAAELDRFGMIGFGKIYREYKKGVIIGDDEVAVTHGIQSYQKTITALVNDRFTIKKALKEKIINLAQANALLLRLKKQPYFSRSLYLECRSLALHDFLSWLEHSYVDQKKLDAIGLLKLIAKNIFFKSGKNPPLVKQTLFSRKLYREIANSPFEKVYNWLPELEKTLVYEHKREPYIHLVHLAKLMQIMSDIGIRAEIVCEDEIKNELHKKSLKYYLIFVNKYSDFREAFLPGRNDIKKDHFKIEFRLMILISSGIKVITEFIQSLNLKISNMQKQNFINTYRRENKLYTLEALNEWILKNDLSDDQDFHDFISVMAVFYSVVEKNNVDYLGLESIINCKSWLQEAKKLALNFNALPRFQPYAPMKKD